MTPQELRYSVYHLAFQGKLVLQNEAEAITDITSFAVDDAPFDVPATWKWNNMGKCCEMYTGNSISESEKKAKYEGLQEGYDYIGTKDVSFEHVIAYNNGVRIPFKTDFKIAYKDAILMCIEGGSAGRKIAFLDRDVCFGNKLCMFKAQTVLNTFLYYYLQSLEFKKAFMDNMTGIIGGVSIKKLKELLIPIPPITEQKRIVAKIEELLPLIDRYEEAWTKLEAFNKRFPEDMQKSILQMAIQGKLVPQDPSEGTGEELYKQIQAEKTRLTIEGKIKKEKPLPEITGDEIPFDIPDNWKWVRLIDVIREKPTNGFSPKGVDYKTEVRNLTLTATTSGFFRADAYKYVDVQLTSDSKYWLKNGDILIQRSNSRELVGTSCIYNGDDNDFIYPDLMMRIHCLESVDTRFIDYTLKAPMTRNYYSKKASGTSESMPKINQSVVSETVIPLPSLAEQRRIVAKLEELLPLCEKLTEKH